MGEILRKGEGVGNNIPAVGLYKPSGPLSQLIKQEKVMQELQTEKPRLKYIEFMGLPNGSRGLVVFSDQHHNTMGSYPLNRFGVETLTEKMQKWLTDTDPKEIFKQMMEEVDEP